MDQTFLNLSYKIGLSKQLKRGIAYYEPFHGDYSAYDQKKAEHRSRNGRYKNHRRGPQV